MVQPRVGQKIHEAARRPGLGIERPEDHSANPRIDEHARAHAAGLERHDQRALIEPPVAQGPRGLAHGAQLGVAARVGLGLARVAGLRDDNASGRLVHDRPDGRLARVGGLPGELDGASHHRSVGVGRVLWPERLGRVPPGPALDPSAKHLQALVIDVALARGARQLLGRQHSREQQAQLVEEVQRHRQRDHRERVGRC